MAFVHVSHFETNSEDETRAVGASLAVLLPEFAVVSLLGDLGVGKTTLTQGIVMARGAAPVDQVSSPTFALIHEYGDPVSVYHIDLYRIETESQASRLGLDELFDRPALVLVEWGENFPTLLPPNRWLIRLNLATPAGNARKIDLYSPQ